MQAIDYKALDSFEALPTIRGLLVSGAHGFVLKHLPEISNIQANTLYSGRENNVFWKASAPNDIEKAMEQFHVVSHAIFKNLSHALELPWEKYLGEMHEFAAMGDDELQIVNFGAAIPNMWSTLTILVNQADPKEAMIIFGEALSVFSEAITPVVPGKVLNPNDLGYKPASPQGNWIVYYIRLNNSVRYTRTAGALMTPLSKKEHDMSRRVGELNIAQGM